MQWVENSTGEITQGSIVEGVDWGLDEAPPLSIVLSNACDIDNNKCGFLIVLGLVPAQETLLISKEFKNKVEGANENQELKERPWRSFCEFIKNYIHNKNICRYYFFDPTPIIDAPLFFADFQMIKSIPYSNVTQLKCIGRLSSPFIEQLVMHFAGYSARIPSNRVDDEKENKLILELSGGYKSSPKGK